MRSLHSRWNALLEKLGFTRKGRSNWKRNNFHNVRNLRFEAMEDRRMLATLTVNTTSDGIVFENGTLSLREAIAIVNDGDPDSFNLSQAELNQIDDVNEGFGSNDTILFHSSISQIQLADQAAAPDELEITKSVVISGPGAESLEIVAFDEDVQSTGNGRTIFFIRDVTGGGSPPLVQIIGLTLRGADTVQQALSGSGGAIFSEGILTIRESVITGNAADKGGAIYQRMAGDGSSDRTVLTIENTLIDDNHARLHGGAIYFQPYSETESYEDTISFTDSISTRNAAKDSVRFAPFTLAA